MSEEKKEEERWIVQNQQGDRLMYSLCMQQNLLLKQEDTISKEVKDIFWFSWLIWIIRRASYTIPAKAQMSWYENILSMMRPRRGGASLCRNSLDNLSKLVNVSFKRSLLAKNESILLTKNWTTPLFAFLVSHFLGSDVYAAYHNKYWFY